MGILDNVRNLLNLAPPKKVSQILTEGAKRVNIPYANVTLDVGGALKGYNVLWNFQDEFKSMFIHLCDFRLMKECFNV